MPWWRLMLIFVCRWFRRRIQRAGDQEDRTWSKEVEPGPARIDGRIRVPDNSELTLACVTIIFFSFRFLQYTTVLFSDIRFFLFFVRFHKLSLYAVYVCIWFVGSFSIDANDENANYGPGRLINHSVIDANIRPVFCKDLQRLLFVADEDIPAGAQLFYDYNDQDPEALQEPDNSFLKRPAKRPVTKEPAKQKKRGRPSKRKLASSSSRRSSSADTVSIYIFFFLRVFVLFLLQDEENRFIWVGLYIIGIVLNIID